MTRAEYITSVVRKLDYKLFCVREENLHVIKRKKSVPRIFELDDGSTLTYLEEKPHNILYLTDNWTLRGNPVDWGVDQVVARLNYIDAQKRDLFREMEEHNQKIEESEKRHTRNEIEAWASDARPVFKKIFSDINTSTVNKVDRRRLKDKQIKN